MSNQFLEIDRSEPITLPGDMAGWLDGNDLARFIVEVVETLDTGDLEKAYRGGGSAPYPPKMMLALLFYGYAKGIFSSRKIERATYEWIPVLYITGGTHPDHDSINTFRKRFLPQLESLFVQILQIAHDLGILKRGDVTPLTRASNIRSVHTLGSTPSQVRGSWVSCACLARWGTDALNSISPPSFVNVVDQPSY